MSTEATPPPKSDHPNAGPHAAKHGSWLPLFQAVKPITAARSRTRRPGWTSARGVEHSAGAGLHQDCRHAGRHRVLHAAAAHVGVRRVRLLALPGGRGRFRDRCHSRRRAGRHGAARKRAICGAGRNGGAADRWISAVGAIAQAGFSGRLPLADGAGRFSHGSGISGQHRGVGRDARTRGSFSQVGWKARRGAAQPATSPPADCLSLSRDRGRRLYP